MSYIYRIYSYFCQLFAKERKKKKPPLSRYSTPLKSRPCKFENAEPPFRRCNSDLNVVPASRVMKATPMIRKSYQTPAIRRFKSHTPHVPREFSRNFGEDSHISICNGSNLYDSAPDFCKIPLCKGSQSSINFADNTFPECENCGNSVSTQRHKLLRNNPASHPDISRKNNACSRIPVLINQTRVMHSTRPNGTAQLVRQHRGVHTLKGNSEEISYECKEKEQSVDYACSKSLDIGNWIAYRNDTSLKFERIFKSMVKKRHVIGNIIDVHSHIHWMVHSGITVDKDGNMFKKFAGGKVVLTFGEYKFLIQNLCSIHDLDYWDILRKMATFQGEDLDHDMFYPVNEN